ncbi:hypothetical protein [Bacillus cereus]|uniref:Phage protein n=1 Tax=Bacillus cereus HuA3-9 TaxID=1053205 RepID=R8CIB5_BACCE|nr:hypothetical protein [Bacillus cereus]EOO11328.1 hypothetical protein IGA_05591 [Bacillus cereus HuA3-9]
MAKYRKKPIVIEAELYRAGLEDGFEFYGIGGNYICYMTNEEMKTSPYPKANRVPVIETLEGRMKVSNGDYIVTGINGEKYPCKPDIFEKTYELVSEA